MEPGIYPNLSREAYDAIDAVNQSLLKQVDRSLAHAKAYIDGHRKTTESLAFGAAYHAYLLEPERFAKAYHVVPKMRRAGKEWEALAEQYGADNIIWDEDVATFEAMKKALASARRRRELMNAKGEHEVTVVWKHGEHLCKARLDKYIPGLDAALDLKKTTDARERAFVNSVCSYGYDLQAAFYIDGLQAVTGRPHGFVFLAQEDEPPFASAMYVVDSGSETHLVGQALYRNLLAQLSYAKNTGDWRGYSDDPSELVLPKWRKEGLLL